MNQLNQTDTTQVPPNQPNPANTSRKPFYEQFGIVASAAQQLALESIPELAGVLTTPIWTIKQPAEIPAGVLMLRGQQGAGNTLAVVQALLDCLQTQLHTLDNLMEAANATAQTLADELRLKRDELQTIEETLRRARAAAESQPPAD